MQKSLNSLYSGVPRERLLNERLALLDKIASKTAQYAGITADELKSPSRARRFFVARKLMGIWVLGVVGITQSEYARYLGRDHTSVMSMMKNVPEDETIEWQEIVERYLDFVGYHGTAFFFEKLAASPLILKK